jgi:hypothetical protein
MGSGLESGQWGQGSNLVQLCVSRFRALTPNFGHLAEKLFDQRVARQAVVRRDIGKDRSQCADSQLIVIRNREVVLRGLIAS